jgi:hypothetical protein
MILGVEDSDDAATVLPDVSKIVMIAPDQTLNVSIPVSDAKNFGLTFVAASTVSVTLIDGTGAIVATNLGDTPEAGQIFRSISVDRAMTKGKQGPHRPGFGEAPGYSCRCLSVLIGQPSPTKRPFGRSKRLPEICPSFIRPSRTR